jgi:ABC-type phosphate transport system auxiliary subunit
MGHDALRNSSLARTLAELMGDVRDLLQKELRLASLELKTKLSSGLQAGVWMAAAGLFAVVAVLLLLEGVVFLIASFGLALYWSCFIVTFAVATLAGILFFYGRSMVDEDLVPRRTLSQIGQDIHTAKEQLT